MDNVLDVLQARGLFDAATSPEAHRALNSPVTVYAGFDPSSPSLQVGNYVTIMALAHFQRRGHRVIALVGGATGMIGDPSGKSSERELLGPEAVARNAAGIRENLSRFLDFEHPTAPALLVNNADWLGAFPFIEFLRDVGKHFRMGSMLGRESVRARLNSEAGMSFTEFSYALLQGYDFLHLYDTYGCTVQIGGSDQWGNITAGIDLIRRVRGVEAYGLTFPLICDSAGQKFGKSEGNAVYLNGDLTSCYDFYQFFLRTTDEDAPRFLRIFTFVPEAEVVELERLAREQPERRPAQIRLAEELTRAVHGEEGLRLARQASEVLFGGSMEGLRAGDLLGIFADVPSAELGPGELEGATVVDVAARCGLCRSKGEARRLLAGGGLYVNNRRVEDPERTVKGGDLVDGRVLVLRSGKKRFYLIKAR